MIDANDTAGANTDSAAKGDDIKPSGAMAEIDLLIAWLQHTVSISAEIFDLFQLEVRLAVTDVKRLILLAKLVVPMLILTWISFSALLSWHIYLLNASVSQGLLFLCLFQFFGLLVISISWKYYQKSLSLPLTRQHIRQLIKGQSSDS